MTAPDPDLQLDQSDVLVEDYVPDGCDNCSAAVTKAVSLDIRSIGTRVLIGVYCGECAAEVAARIRAGLPPQAEP